MIEKDKDDDDDIIVSATTTAMSQFPEPKLSWGIRLFAFLAILVIIVNTALGIYNTSVLTHNVNCTRSINSALVHLRVSNSPVRDWIDATPTIKSLSDLQALKIAYDKADTLQKQEIASTLGGIAQHCYVGR